MEKFPGTPKSERPSNWADELQDFMRDVAAGAVLEGASEEDADRQANEALDILHTLAGGNLDRAKDEDLQNQAIMRRAR